VVHPSPVVPAKPASRINASKVVALRDDEEIADAELVRRAREGDRWAEGLLVRRHFAGVAGTVARLLGDLDEAQDVVQETFAAALAELADLREPAAVRAWLMQIAVRKVHRRFRRRKLLRVFGLRSGESESRLAQLVSSAASPEQHVELALLDGALSRLPAADRIAWTLRRVEGMRLEDVALSCRCSLATAKRRIAAADRVVRAHVALDETGDE
jgi:RNA polymerase sigma-70 factor (ECF subfamily)